MVQTNVIRKQTVRTLLAHTNVLVGYITEEMGSPVNGQVRYT